MLITKWCKKKIKQTWKRPCELMAYSCTLPGHQLQSLVYNSQKDFTRRFKARATVSNIMGLWRFSKSGDTWSTLKSTVSRQLTNFRLIHMSWLTISQLLTLTVDQVSIKCQSRCQPRCWLNYVNRRSIESIDWHSVADAFSAYDPIYALQKG